MPSERSLRGDSRGVAPLVGFILLLGILVTALAVYQVTFVPAQNSEVEFKHSQDVRGDMENLRAATLSTGTVTDQTAERTSVRIRLGVQYPSRLVALNPPPAEGHLRTEAGNLTIANAETAANLRGNPNETLFGVDHETRLFEYEPGYTEAETPPELFLEHSLLYNQEGGANVTFADQRLVQNDSKLINVVLLEGEFNEQGMSGTVDLVAVDGPTGTVPVQAASGSTFTITIPTNAPDAWTSNETLGDSFSTGEPNVRATKTGSGTVNITIDDSVSEQWELQVTRLGVGSGESSSTLSDIGPYEEPLGPEVALTMPDTVTVTQGDTVNVTGTTTSIGDGQDNRTGTPLQTVRAEIEGEPNQTLFDEDPDTTNRTLDLGDPVVDDIDTSGWSSGTHNVTIRVQDASGLWSERDTDSFVIDVS
jgi:hypothetical protein